MFTNNDTSTPSDRNVVKKEAEKIIKYKDPQY